MFAISEDWANYLYFWFSVMVLAGTVMGVVGGLGVLLADRVRDGYANATIAQLNESTEKLKQENIDLSIKLAELQAPRRLSSREQELELIEKLRALPTKVPIVAMASGMDRESQHTLSYLTGLFSQAGWEIRPSQGEAHVPPIHGVEVEIFPGEPESEAAKVGFAVAEQLAWAGIIAADRVMSIHQSVEPGTIRIVVGPKETAPSALQVEPRGGNFLPDPPKANFPLPKSGSSTDKK